MTEDFGNIEERSVEQIIEEESNIIDYESLLKTYDLQKVADDILEASYGVVDIMKKDSIDRLLDFIYFKVQTGFWNYGHMAYPTKTMNDKQLEDKLIDLINNYLYPEIVLKLLKFFTRNIHDSDSNLYVANLITSEDVIKSIYEAYILFKKDIFEKDEDKRSLNVKRIQQFSPRSDNKLSSPLDAAARLKYILEFLYSVRSVDHIFTKEDLMLSKAV